MCAAYWFPLYAYVRRQGHRPHDAQDLTQGFFAWLIESKHFRVADAQRGRLRSFMLGMLKSFLSDDRKKMHAQKRGGGRVPVSLDAASAEERYSLEPVTELQSTTEERRKRALVFVSYRGADRDLAIACALRLEAQGYEVVKYDPNQLWDNPMEKIIRSVTTANTVIYIAGASSDWIKAEIELSKELGLPFFTVHSLDEIDAQNAAIRSASLYWSSTGLLFRLYRLSVFASLADFA